MSEENNNNDDNGGGDDFKMLVPEAYRDKAYLAEAKSLDDVFTMLDGAETLIGKRAAPGDDATAEQLVEFYNTIGRPESADGYNPGLEEGKTDELFDKLRPAFHGAGLTVRQAKGLFKEAGPILQQLAGDEIEKQKAADAEFETLSTKYLGTEKDAKLAKARTMLVKHAPADLAGALDQLDNTSLVMMSAVLSQMHDKFYKEKDDLGGDGKVLATGVEGMKKRCLEISAKLQKEGSTMPSEEKAKLKKEFNELHAKREQAGG